MAIKISSKIKSYKVKTEEPVQAPVVELETLHEDMARPEMLIGSTYKIKTPQSEHAMYVTINDIILNEGTEHEVRKPYEVFINSKNMEHYQWVVAMTRVMSAVFRKGGNVTFLIDELKGVFDPKGGYFKKGGLFMPSIVAELGYTIEKHMRLIGMIEADRLSSEQKEFIESKRKELNIDAGSYPKSATMCDKCNEKAVIVMDGCATCLSCGNSKCG
jgi:hypothetical protein